MPSYYRALRVIAASLSFTVAGVLGACSSDGPKTITTVAGDQRVVAPTVKDDEIDTDSTIWTLLGIADKPPPPLPDGRRTGAEVSPVLWQATHDALKFTRFASEDPQTGSLVTDWYSPPDKPNERLRVIVLITSRALRSDSVSVSVERQARTAGGQWAATTVDKDVADNIDSTILYRARQIHRAQPAG